MSTVPDPVKRPLRVYLAGKIARDDWRHEIVRDLRWLYDDEDYYNSVPWPISEDAIAPGVDYVGPYFVSCGHGGHELSEGDHAMGGTCSGDVPMHIGDTTGGHGCYTYELRQYAAHMCIEAIKRCDLMLAVVTPDAHGTLVEVGYAHALGKEIMIVRGGQQPTDEFGGFVLDDPNLEAWFPFALDGVMCPQSLEHAMQCIRVRGHRITNVALCESPIEVAFWHAMQGIPELRDFRPQIKLDGGRYRLDFGHDEKRIGVELDGYEFHSSKDQFIKDRQRHREIESMGWRVIRFAGSEVHTDARACARQLVTWMATL